MNKNNPNLSQTSGNAKKYSSPKIGFRFVFFMVLLFYFVPLLAKAAGADSTKFSDYLYLYTTTFYTIIVLSIIIFHAKGLDIIRDHFSLWMIALGCFLAASQARQHDTVYKIFLAILGFRLLIYIIVNRKSMEMPNLKSIFIGLLWSAITIIATVLLLVFLNPIRQPLPSNLLAYILDTFLYQIAFVAVIEEAWFRGLLFSFLVMNGYQEDRALVIQGILFWGGHYMKISTNPALFFVAVPILTLSTSLITKKYKMLYLPVIVHTLANVLGPVLVAIL